jgi:hypothetical protein
MPLFARSDRPSIAADSSKQSPTVISRRVPPFTARMVPARRSAAVVIVRPAGDVAQSAASSANPFGSRTRVMIETRFCGARGVSTHSRLGRITSAATSSSAQTRRLLAVDTPQRGFSGRAQASSGRHQSALPAASAPLASHRCCQLPPGCSLSQSSSRANPSRRRCRTT